MERCLWPLDHTGSGSAVGQVSQLPPGQPRSGRSGSSEHHLLQFDGGTSDHVSVSPGRPPAACGARPARPVFVRLTVSTTSGPRITVTSVFSAMLPGVSTGHRPNRRSSAAPTSLAQTESPRDSTSPSPTQRAPDRFRTSSSETSCLFTCRATTTSNKTMGAQHYNFSVQRQLDKSTVLTVAYVGTLGHHIEHGVNILWGSASLCQSLAGCGPGGEGWRLPAKWPKHLRLPSLGPIDNQTISPNYTNSSGGPVVAFAESQYLQNSGNL